MSTIPEIESADKQDTVHHAVPVLDAAELAQKGDVAAMTFEDRATAFHLAHAADPGIPALSLRWWRFFGIALVIWMAGGDNGFDNAVMSSVNSMTQFQSYFGIKAASGTSLVFGIYNVGSVAGFFPVIMLSDRIGRRWVMFIGAGLLMVGAFLTGFATNFGMFLGGRFLTAFGCNITGAGAKIYLTEIAPPATRGRWCGMIQTFYYTGSILATGIAIPLGKIATPWAWRIPILIQVAPAFITFAFVFFLPDSPRWLYARGEKEKAIAILADLHSLNRDVNSPLIQLEVAEIDESIGLDAQSNFWDFSSIFGTAATRYRFMMACLIAIPGQLCGNGLTSYFLPTLLAQAGLTNTNTQRVLNFVNSIVSFIGALIGVWLTDSNIAGRRSVLIFAILSCTVIMLLCGGLLANVQSSSNPARANAGIAFLYLFGFGYSVGFTPLQGLYPGECATFEGRAKQVALFSWVATAVNLVNTFGLPSAFAAISWKMYFIFFAANVCWSVWIYIYAVETKWLSLEDLHYVFDSKNPRETSIEISKVARKRALAERDADLE